MSPVLAPPAAAIPDQTTAWRDLRAVMLHLVDVEHAAVWGRG